MKMHPPSYRWILALLILIPSGTSVLSATLGYGFFSGFLTGLGVITLGLHFGFWRYLLPLRR
jgi:hypothetical protein